jgi:glutathione S-transferase
VKLFWSPNSPFARKVVATAILNQLDGRIERITLNPHESSAELLAANPLSKVPCLITDDGVALFDSPVICEYLDSLEGVPAVFPQPGPARWKALKLQALGDGIMEAAVLRRGLEASSGGPPDAVRATLAARQKAAMARALDLLERESPHRTLDIGTITVAAALGYLDLRFAADGWREGRPGLATWFAAIGHEPALARTVPPGDG